MKALEYPVICDGKRRISVGKRILSFSEISTPALQRNDIKPDLAHMWNIVQFSHATWFYPHSCSLPMIKTFELCQSPGNQWNIPLCKQKCILQVTLKRIVNQKRTTFLSAFVEISNKLVYFSVPTRITSSDSVIHSWTRTYQTMSACYPQKIGAQRMWPRGMPKVATMRACATEYNSSVEKITKFLGSNWIENV